MGFWRSGGGVEGKHTILAILEAGEVLQPRAVERCEGLPGACHLCCHCIGIVRTIGGCKCRRYDFDNEASYTTRISNK